MTPHPERIGLVFGFGLDFFRDILRGIKSYAEARPHWIFTPIANDPAALRAIVPLRLDGLIAHIFDRRLAGALGRLRRPVVNVSGVLPELAFPRVGVDHEAVGAMAFAHFLDRGYRRFGFVGYPEHDFSRRRESGFRAAAREAGFGIECHHSTRAPGGDLTGLWSWDERLMTWLNALPKPAGILTSHDIQGIQVSEACRQAGLRVPDDVAIVGVDDDDLLCFLARPTLSSVALPAERIGFEAAALLDRLMRGERPPDQPLRLRPTGVVARGSSEALAVCDADVAAAVRHIRRNADRPIRVQDILDAVPVSRRSLERRFRASLGRGLWEEIRRSHMERARSLLSGTEMPIAEVARRSGFSDAKQLSVVFRQETGQTPTSYRRQFRSPGVENMRTSGT